MSRPFPIFFWFVFFSGIFNDVAAQKPGVDSLTVEKALATYRLSSPLIAPDGKKCVFVVRQPATMGKAGASHIWLLDLRDNSTRQYTNSEKSESNPKWAPKGGKLAFTSSRNGESQVYILDDNGGEAIALTASKTGVSDYEWSPDGKAIAYTEEDSLTSEEKKRKDEKYDEEAMSKHDKASALFSIDLASKTAHRWPGKNWKIAGFKYMPSGEALVLEVEALPAREIPSLQLVSFEWKDSSYHDIPSPKNPAWGGVEIAPGGKLFAFSGPRVDGPVAHDVFLQAFGEPAARNITGKSIDLPVQGVKFVSDDALFGVVQQGMHTVLYKIPVNGKAVEVGIKMNVSAYDLIPDEKVVFVSGNASALPELWLYTGANAAPVQLTHFNKAFDKLPLRTPSILHYNSFDGKAIETLFYTPDSGTVKGRLPMVVIIHGGPTGAWADSYNDWAQLFLQKGYAVMMPNIRGSTGYGFGFLESNRRDWGGGDFKDIMAGIDYLVANKGVDSGRLAIVGWSYGGYMSEWAITQTNRFKAAMSGAGLFNLGSEFGTEGGAAYDKWFLGTPYENAEVFNKHSAISFVKHVHTPMLIIQGKDDDVDPIGQSQELYRALRYYNVPTELVLYPNEHHGFVDLRHRTDYISRMLEWVGKYCPAGTGAGK